MKSDKNFGNNRVAPAHIAQVQNAMFARRDIICILSRGVWIGLRRMRNYNTHKGEQWSVTECWNFYAYVIWDWGVLLSYKCKWKTGMQGHNVQLWFKWEFYSLSSTLVLFWVLCAVDKIIKITKIYNFLNVSCYQSKSALMVEVNLHQRIHVKDFSKL